MDEIFQKNGLKKQINAKNTCQILGKWQNNRDNFLLAIFFFFYKIIMICKCVVTKIHYELRQEWYNELEWSEVIL